MTLKRSLEPEQESRQTLRFESSSTLITLEGMPLIAVRQPTGEERKALAYATVAGMVCGAAGGVLCTEVWRVELPMGLRLIFMVIGLPFCLAAYWLSQPALQALLRHEVLEFEGRPVDFGSRNRHDGFLRRDRENRVVTTPDARLGIRVNQEWSYLIGGAGAFTKVAIVEGPDTRELTATERIELEAMARYYQVCGMQRLALLGILMMALWFPIGLALGANETTFIGPIGVFVLVSDVVIGPFREVRKRLRADCKSGQISGGRLGSGLPWIVDGKPAKWRFWRPVPWIDRPTILDQQLPEGI